MDQVQALSARKRVDLPSSGLAGDFAVVSACTEASTRRAALERYISGIFSAAYGASILEYLPLLFSLEKDGHYNAALGLRSAAAAPLFCEQYLDSTVEDEAFLLYGDRADRSKIMELGNLVATSPGQSAFLYLLVTAALQAADVQYLLFAANKSVRASIRRSGFTPRVIGVADGNRLGPEAKNWGTYYEGEPFVMLADISLTMEQASAQPMMCRLIDNYRHSIPVLADAIGKHIP